MKKLILTLCQVILIGILTLDALNRMFLYLRDNPTMLALSAEKGLTRK